MNKYEKSVLYLFHNKDVQLFSYYCLWNVFQVIYLSDFDVNCKIYYI